MAKSKELFSYAFVVFESLWPNLPDEAPKLVGKISDNKKSTATTIFKYNPNQNSYTGYYRLIPLNTISLDITQSKQGHAFKAVFDPSLVYLEAHPNTFSADVYRFIRENALDLKKDSEISLNILLGAMEGVSKYDYASRDKINEIFNTRQQNLEKFILPGTILSQLVSEMDTATIFIINDNADFDSESLIKLAGGTFSRKEEYSGTQQGQKLIDIGITPSEISATDNSIGNKILVMRKFYSQANLTIGLGLNAQPTQTAFSLTENKTERTNSFKKELDATKKFIQYARNRNKAKFADTTTNAVNNVLTNSAGVDFNNVMGDVIFDKYALKITSDPVFGEQLSKYITDYYTKSGNRTNSKIIPWSLYETIRIQLANFLPGYFPLTDFTQGLLSETDATEKVIISIGIDLIFRRFYKEESTRLANIVQTSNTDVNYNLLVSLLTAFNKYYGTKLSAERYIDGASVLFNVIGKLLSQQIAQKAQNNVVDNLNLSFQLNINDISELPGLTSSHTPFLALKGHVTGVSTNANVNETQATKTVSISGEGLEVTLKRTNIFFDQTNREKIMFKNLQERYGISGTTPIDGAISIMNNFMPDAPLLEAIDQNQTQNNVRINRSKEYFTQPFSTALKGNVVTQGTVVFPQAADTQNDAFVFSPIHYISTSYLKVVKTLFTDIGLDSANVSSNPQQLNEGSVYSALNRILSNNSTYSFFVDEFGYLKIRYEASSVSTPTSTILNPIINDNEIINIQTSTDDSEVYTLVEVTPTAISYGSPNGGYLVGQWGRALPPSVADANKIYKTVELNPNSSAVRNFLKTSFLEFNSLLNKYWREYAQINKIQTPELIVPKTGFFNKPDYENNIRAYYLKTKKDVVSTVSEPVQVPINTVTSSSTSTQPTINPVDARYTYQNITDPELKAFANKTVQIATSLRLDPTILMTIMQFESGGANAADVNQFGCVGLIQFCPGVSSGQATVSSYIQAQTGRKYNTTNGEMTNFIKSLPRVSLDGSIDQLDLVHEYLRQNIGQYAKWISRPDLTQEQATYTLVQNPYAGPDTADGNGKTAREITNRPSWTSARERAKTILFGNPNQSLPYDNKQVTQTSSQTTYKTIINKYTKTNSVDATIWNSTDLSNWFVETASSKGTALSTNFYINRFDNIQNLTSESVILWVVNPKLSDTYNNLSISLYDQMVMEYKSFINNFYKNNNDFGITFSISSETAYYMIDLLSTLSVLGMNSGNVTTLLNGNSLQGKLIIQLVKNSQIKTAENVDNSNKKISLQGQKLSSGDASVQILYQQFGAQLPYAGLELQNLLPSNISADLFRYGLRMYRADDNYLVNSSYPKFRAEFFRRLHDEPLRSAQVQIIGDTSYKVGNTTLVVSERIDEYKNNYIHIGTYKTMQDLDKKSKSDEKFKYLDLILKIDDMFSFDLSKSINITNPFVQGGSIKVNYQTIKQHFFDAYKFMLDVSNGEPVPISSYVPLFGVYSNNAYPEVKEYLAALIRVNTDAATYVQFKDDIFSGVKDSIKNILSNISITGNNKPDVFNILRLLEPQKHHAYQYHVEGIQNRWNFGEIFSTTLNMNYGLPVAYVYVPYFYENDVTPNGQGQFAKLDSQNFKKHILGWCINKSPYLLYNSRGLQLSPTSNQSSGQINIDNPLYTFSYQQYKQDSTFYVGSERYSNSMLLEKIRRKKEMPQFYGTFGNITKQINGS